MNEGLYILQGEEEKKKGIHYEVDLNRELGAGGMGRVLFGYRVDEKHGTRREVAVKFLYGNLDKSEIDRARREASIQLRNDNLVEMFGLVEIRTVDEDNQPVVRQHVVSEYLNGVTLQDLMEGKTTDKSGKEIPGMKDFLNEYKRNKEKFAVKVLKHMLSGIQALHDAGYVHRDIDPGNIMLTSDKRIKLIDFGVVHELDSSKSNTEGTVVGTFIGKPAYAAPEIVLGDVLNHKETTDIYALGILFFQLLTGHLPFTGNQQEVMKNQINDPLPLEEIKEEKLRDIIRQATEKQQENRFQSAAEFRVALDKYPSLKPTPAPKPAPTPSKKDKKKAPKPTPEEKNKSDVEPKNDTGEDSYTWLYIALITFAVIAGAAMAFLM